MAELPRSGHAEADRVGVSVCVCVAARAGQKRRSPEAEPTGPLRDSESNDDINDLEKGSAVAAEAHPHSDTHEHTDEHTHAHTHALSHTRTADAGEGIPTAGSTTNPLAAIGLRHNSSTDTHAAFSPKLAGRSPTPGTVEADTHTHTHTHTHTAAGTERLPGGACTEPSDDVAATAESETAAAASEPIGVKKRRAALTEEEAAAAAARAAVINACKNVDLPGALAAYEAMLAAGHAISSHVYNAVLNLCTRATGRVDAPLLQKAVKVFRDMEARGITGNEAAFTSIIRLATVAGDIPVARQFFDDMTSKGISPRLRTYAPLLQAYSRAGDCASAEWLYNDMARREIEPQQPEFAAMLSALGRMQRHDDVIALLHRVMDASAVGEYVQSPLLEACQQYFSGAFASGAEAPSPMRAMSLPATSARSAVLEQYPRRTTDASWRWRCARVRIDPAEGRCPATGRMLRSLDVSESEYASLVDQVQALAMRTPKQFETFREWLARHGPFDVIVDGANVGFFNQNFQDGGLMYTQIDAVVRWFERRGLKVLLIIGRRWLEASKFRSAGSRKPSAVRRRRDGLVAGTAGTKPSLPFLQTSGTPGAPSGDGAGAASGAAAEGVTEAPGTATTGAAFGAESMLVASEGSAPSSGAAGRRAARGFVFNNAVLAAAIAGEACESAAPGANVTTHTGQPRDTDLNWWSALRGAATTAPDAPSSDESSDSDSGDQSSSDIYVATSVEDDSAVAADIIDRWTSDDTAYRVPPGGNDDWYWLYAALTQNTGKSTIVVSNDLMRDHHFQMLAPLAFLRWRERHQVFFSFEFSSRRRAFFPVLQFPRLYSHRMQPSQDGRAWYFPVADTADEWLVAWEE